MMQTEWGCTTYGVCMVTEFGVSEMGDFPYIFKYTAHICSVSK